MKNEAVFMTALNKLQTREVPMPVAKPGQVIVKVEYVGICGSDSHYLETGRIGDFVVEGDFILGHECAGTVIEIGEQVSSLKIGDRVALEPGITCGQCEFCKTGRYNLCPDVEFLATPPYHGSLVRYLAFPANMCFKLPENVSTLEGSLVEPLAVGMHAAAQGEVKLGQTVAILGGGTIGLMTLLAAKAYGATTAYVVDMLDNRLDLAKKLGAVTINAGQINAVEKILAATAGQGVDIVFETAGAVPTIRQTPHLVKRGGTIVLVGLCAQDEVNFNFMQIMMKEAQIKSVFRYRNIYPAAIAAIADGKIQVKDMVTRIFDFADADKAFAFVQEHKKDVIKAVIKL